MVDPGETPDAAALRELEEEVLHTTNKLSSLGTIIIDPGINNQEAFIFVAESITPASSQQADPNEIIEPHRVTPEKVEEMIQSGEMNSGWPLAMWMKYTLKKQ